MSEVIERGRLARDLLENETFQEVMQTLRDETMARWRNTAAGSATLREHYFFEIHGLDAVEGLLRSRVEDAESEIRRLEKLNEPKARKWA